VGGDFVEEVELVDEFKKDGKISHCYRISYRSFERTLTQGEVNKIHGQICEQVRKLGGVVR
jgi:phenylalanyl-tRNA synthetase alpha chain